MKEHDILGISVFANEAEIEKAYSQKLKLITDANTGADYSELAEKKCATLEQARESCLKYRQSSFAEKTAVEIKDMAKMAASPATLNNLCPCGPVFILGNLCGADGGYYDFCNTCSGDGDCCQGLSDDIMYTICGIADAALWFGGFKILELVGKNSAKEQAETVSQYDIARKEKSDRDAATKRELSRKAFNLKEKADETKRKAEIEEKIYNGKINRIVRFSRNMNISVNESTIRSSPVANDYRKAYEAALNDDRTALSAHRAVQEELERYGS